MFQTHICIPVVSFTDISTLQQVSAFRKQGLSCSWVFHHKTKSHVIFHRCLTQKKELKKEEKKKQILKKYFFHFTAW